MRALDLRPAGMSCFQLGHRGVDIDPLGSACGPRQGGHDPQPLERHGGGIVARGLRQADLVERAGQHRHPQVGGPSRPSTSWVATASCPAACRSSSIAFSRSGS